MIAAIVLVVALCVLVGVVPTVLFRWQGMKEDVRDDRTW